MLAPLILSALVAGAPSAEVQFVIGSLARIRAAPDKTSMRKATLPIGAEVKVRGRAGGFLEVEALSGERGFVKATLLSASPPSVDALLKKHAAAKGSARLRTIERATALAPSRLDVIERLAADLAARGETDRVYFARKGWVAAKRRSLMWDGPLYPIVDGTARFPAPCDTHSDVPAGPNGMDQAKLDDTTRVLRTRAFPWVSSGKVVSVSGHGYKTQKLDRLACHGAQLGYRMAGSAQRGALVPSWMVAGFKVTPFFAGQARSDRRRVWAALKDQTLSVRAMTFAEERSSKVTLAGLSAPLEAVAMFSEGPGVFTVLVTGAGQRACAPGERAAALVRATVDGDALTLEQGRVWSAGFVEGCAQETFPGLEGEPRDISREHLASDEWKR